MVAVIEAELGERCGEVKILWMPRGLKQVDERVAIAGHAVAQAVTLFQQSSLPDGGRTRLGHFQVV